MPCNLPRKPDRRPGQAQSSGAFPLLKQTDEASAFDGDEKPAYKITLSPESIESLKNEPKVFVKAKFESGDVKLENVGVRLKGFIGSFRPFDGQNKNGYGQVQRLQKRAMVHGLKKLQLNNAAQDSTYIRESSATRCSASRPARATRRPCDGFCKRRPVWIVRAGGSLHRGFSCPLV